MKVWIRSNRCYPWECVSGGARVCVLMCLHCDIRTQRGLSWGELVYTACVHENTWGSYCTYVYLHSALKHTCTLCSWRLPKLICVLWQLSPFHFLSCLDSTFLFESPLLNRTEQKRGVKRSGGCVRPCWGGDRIKLSRRCFWKVLLQFNRLWESLDPAIMLRSLVQDLQGWTVRKTDSIICPHTFPAVLYTHLWRVEIWGGTSLKADTEKADGRRKGRYERQRRDEGKDSWYLNHAGWLFCAAKVYLKRSSICSAPLCFQPLWGNAHTVTGSVPPFSCIYESSALSWF